MLPAPQLSTLLMVNIFSFMLMTPWSKVVIIFDFVILLVVPWGLVVGDGEPFDIELYPPGWLI